MEEKEIEKSDFFVNPEFIHRRTITINGKEHVFGFKEISGYDRDIVNKSTVAVDKDTKKITTNIEIGNLALLKQSLVEAPFEINIENLKLLKNDIQKQLLKIIDEVNKVEEKTLKN